MATTLSSMVDRVQDALQDPGGTNAYADATVQYWIYDAIREYSILFPRIQTILLTAPTYDLDVDYIDMVSVEYPPDEDPKEYLKRKDHRHPDFYESDDWYDVRVTDAYTDPVLITSKTDIADGEQIRCYYTAYHSNEKDGHTNLTIPVHHEHLIVLFCVWKAAQYRLGLELQGPDTTVQIVNQVKAAAWEARDAYYKALRDIEKRHLVTSGMTGPWQSDEHDRIY